MDMVLWVIAVVALLIAWTSRSRLAETETAAKEAKRLGEAVREEVVQLTEQVGVMRKLLASVAGGHEIDATMVREGRLYRVVLSEALQQRMTAGEKLCVLDVRTPAEWASGHIPGAQHIPIDDLDKNMHVVKRDGTPMFVICAGGGRSAAASKQLSDRGYLNVFNVEGGMKSWRGEVSKD
jgi:rhodanese-related sulfurtransferase